MELGKALANIIIIVSIYLMIGFVFESSLPLLPFPSPPAPPSGGFDLVRYILQLVAFLFGSIMILIRNMLVIMSFSYLPFPYNVLLAVPINGILIYSIIVVLKEMIQSVKIPLMG